MRSAENSIRSDASLVAATGVGKMRNCGMRKVKCGIQKCGNVCGTVGKMWNAECTAKWIKDCFKI